MAPGIAIGTAQFGLDYGITNQAGRVAASEVAAILDYAHAHAVEWLDTAAAYGDAEAVIGEEPRAARFKLCTKVGASGSTAIADLAHELDASLARMGRPRADILLLHRPDALIRDAGATLAWARREKGAGRIGAFGVSLYHADEEALALLPGIDWIQVPISILSQDWITDGALARLRDSGVRVQIRSLLAQGLLAVAPEHLPEALAGIGQPLARVHAAAAAVGCTPVELALAFASQLPVDLLVLGVQSVSQLASCLDALSVRTELDWSSFAGDGRALDPRTWPAGLKI